MTLREKLLTEHSKSNIEEVFRQVQQNPNLLDELMKLFLFDEKRVVQGAAWVIGLMGEKNPEQVSKYLTQLINRCTEPEVPQAVKRNVSRCLHFIDIPNNHQEAAFNLCFDLLANPNESVAARCWSMGVLSKLCISSFPELKSELKMLITDALQHQEITAGFRSKARRVLAQLN